MNCRHCHAKLGAPFIDLGHQPPSNAYLQPEMLDTTEAYAPLKAYVCEDCWLVQLPSFHSSHELFTGDYAYFSSVAKSWVDHASRYVDAMAPRFGVGSESFVVEVASNDGYLLQFINQRGIRCLGVEPTHSTAEAARTKGIATEELFFGEASARDIVARHGKADLTAANNVLAHVPDINDFVAGFREILNPEGVSTFEFPHVLNTVNGGQFDTIYHEHYSYLSLTAVQRIFASQGLRVFDVEEISTHGGSLRVFACLDRGSHAETPNVDAMLAREAVTGLKTRAYYEALAPAAYEIKLDLLAFLIAQKKAGKRVAAYGAAAKGNTLMNYAGLMDDLVDFVCDAAPSKQGKFMPGSHIPILPPDALKEREPDFVLILPWNILDEIQDNHSYIANWGGRFVVAVPALAIL